ncbi:hypothetical protein MKX01_037122 [Papaver californicum]|nr:hypothetical protein MKX01_037122 [Papaver californicum]
MLLGKRARPSMRRTTSMTGLTVHPINMETSLPPLDPSINDVMVLRAHHHHVQNNINSNKQVSLGMGDVNIIDHGFVHHHLSRRNTVGGGDDITTNTEFEQKFMSSNVASPPKPRFNQRRNSGDFSVEAAHFLRSCGLCKSRLAPGRDIFMYRGDTAFCSLECRQQQIQQDEKKEKCSWISKKEIPSVVATVAGPESLNNGETVAAA